MDTILEECNALIENGVINIAKTDYLNRGEFVNRVLRIIEHLSENRTCSTFAIDGSWGCGKTFVMEMIEKELSMIQSEETADDHYVVFHYNSWKHDFYEEPLIAIVSAMIESIDNNKLMKLATRKKIKGILKKTGKVLANVAGSMCAQGIGFNPAELSECIFAGIEDGTKEEECQNSYDLYYSFKKAIKSMRESLGDISKDQTIVIVVDELDRCLPEYAIKVMERLHHLTEGVENVIIIMAIDKNQLKESVKKAFGFNNAEQYLKKFIQFCVPIDTGEIKSKFIDGYADYFRMFTINENEKNDLICFFSVIFSEMDNRKRQQIMEKAFVIHKLLFNNKKKDCAFLFAELLFLVLNDHYQDCSLSMEETITLRNYTMPFSICKDYDGRPIAFSDKFVRFFDGKYNKIKCAPQRLFNDNVLYCEESNIYHVLYYYWVAIHNNKPNAASKNIGCDDFIQLEIYNSGLMQKNTADLREFISYFTIIK